MKSRRFGAVILSVLSGVVGQAMLVGTGVLVARILGAEGRGQLALVALVPVIIAQLGFLGLPFAMTHYIARDPANARDLVVRIAPVAFALTLALVAAHAVVLLLVLRGESDHIRLAAVLTLFAIPGLVGQQYGLAILQGQQRFAWMSTVRPAPAGMYALGVLAIFALGTESLVPVVLAWMSSVVLGAALLLGVAVQGLRGARSEAPGPPRREMLAFGLRGHLGSMSLLETMPVDQAIVGILCGPAALGLYVVGLAFTNLPRFVGQSIGMVAYPHISGIEDARLAKRAVLRFTALSTLACILVVGMIGLAASFLVPAFFGGNFNDSVGLLYLLLPSAFFYGIRRTLGPAISGMGRPGMISVGEVVSWAVFLVVLVFVGPGDQGQGVAIAMSVAAGASLVAVLVPTLPRPTSIPVGPGGLLPHPRGWGHAHRARRNGVGVAGLAVALGIGAFSAATGGGLTLSTFLLIAISATLLCPLVWRAVTRRVDVFEPIYLFVAGWAVMFVVRPTAMMLRNDFFLVRPTRIMDVRASFDEMLLLALIGAITYVVAYSLPVGKHASGWLPKPFQECDAHVLVAVSLGLVLIGLMLFTVYVISTVGLDGIYITLRGRSLERTRALRGSTSYLSSGPMLLVPASLVLLAVARERRMIAGGILGLCAAVVLLILTVPVGSRTTLLPALGGAGVYSYLSRRTRPRFTVIVIIIVGALVSSSVLLTTRGAGSESPSVVGGAVQVVRSPSEILAPLTKGPDGEMAPALAAALQSVPEEVSHTQGRATVGDLLVRPVPRILWSGKPLSPREQVISHMWPTEYAWRIANPEFSIMLVFFLDGGVIGVAAGMALFGIASRMGYEYAMLHHENMMVRLVYALSLPFMIGGVRDSPVDTLIRMCMVVLPVLLIFAVSARRGIPEAHGWLPA